MAKNINCDVNEHCFSSCTISYFYNPAFKNKTINSTLLPRYEKVFFVKPKIPTRGEADWVTNFAKNTFTFEGSTMFYILKKPKKRDEISGVMYY